MTLPSLFWRSAVSACQSNAASPGRRSAAGDLQPTARGGLDQLTCVGSMRPFLKKQHHTNSQLSASTCLCLHSSVFLPWQCLFVGNPSASTSLSSTRAASRGLTQHCPALTDAAGGRQLAAVWSSPFTPRPTDGREPQTPAKVGMLLRLTAKHATKLPWDLLIHKTKLTHKQQTKKTKNKALVEP